MLILDVSRSPKIPNKVVSQTGSTRRKKKLSIIAFNVQKNTIIRK